MKDLLLVGAGHAHVAVLRRSGMKPLPGVRLMLLTREVDTPYSGMLPGVMAGYHTFDDAHIDAGCLARFAGARLYPDEAVGIDLAARRVLCRRRLPVPLTFCRSTSARVRTTSARVRTLAPCRARPSTPFRSSRSTASSRALRACGRGCRPGNRAVSCWLAAGPAAAVGRASAAAGGP